MDTANEFTLSFIKGNKVIRRRLMQQPINFNDLNYDNSTELIFEDEPKFDYNIEPEFGFDSDDIEIFNYIN